MHFARLPSDVVELILQHRAASRIQRTFRTLAYRHVREHEWRRVRRDLLRCLRVAQFDTLQRNSRIRREWTHELASWRCGDEAIEIHAEVVAGWW